MPPLIAIKSRDFNPKLPQPALPKSDCRCRNAMARCYKRLLNSASQREEGRGECSVLRFHERIVRANKSAGKPDALQTLRELPRP